MRIALSAESTIDMPKELLEKYKISTVPFTVVLGDETFLDGEMPISKIFDYVKSTGKLPKTSAVNQVQYEEHFNKLLEDNDAIIHLSLSSEFSSAYSNACVAAKEFDGKVFVIDSCSLSTGIALLAIYARKLIDKGEKPENIVKNIENRIPYDQASFILKRVDYLYKGGRCNMLQLLGANLLKLRPQIIVQDGKMKSGSKYRGNMDVATLKYIEETLKEFNHPDLEEVFITYTTAEPELIEKIKEILRNKGFKNIHETQAGATITSHCGENCLGILYINDAK